MTHEKLTEIHLRELQSRGVFQNDVVAFDLETTGLNVGEDRIVEISISRLDLNGKYTYFNTLVNPVIPIPNDASKTHGIYDETVQNEQTFAAIATNVLSLIDKADIITYNGTNFDMLLLLAEFTRCNMTWNFLNSKNIDVYTIYKSTIPYTLAKVYNTIVGKPLINAHTADVDVYATVHILNELSKSVPSVDVTLLETAKQENFLDQSRMFYRAKDNKIYFKKGKFNGELATSQPGHLVWIAEQSSFKDDTKTIARMLILGVFS